MKLNVLLVTNQIRGIDGTGGLGDVPVGLANSLNQRDDVEVRLIMPGFSEISNPDLEMRFTDTEVLEALPVPLGSRLCHVDLHEIRHPQYERLRCYLIRAPEVFDVKSKKGKIDKNTPDKAILLCRAVVEILRSLADFRVDLVHCNDWHTGLIPVYLKTIYGNDPYLGRIAVHYTSHNSEPGYQGDFSDVDPLLDLARLERDLFRQEVTTSLEHHGNFNFSKAGLGFASLFNTVSAQYRRELLTDSFGGGLSGLFHERKQEFFGILNGLDTEEWNPERDPHLLGASYGPNDSYQDIKKAKRKIRTHLKKWKAGGIAPFQNLNDESFLMGVVSRIDYQKMPILGRALGDLLRIPGVQIAVLGSAGSEDATGQGYVKQLKKKAAGKKLLFFEGFDIPLSHLVYAAADAFLVPSVFEPCGLTQMVAMQYGTVPIVREVGGLLDTVIDEQSPAHRHEATGFSFKETGPYTPDPRADIDAAASALVASVKRAKAVYDEDQPRWGELVSNGMKHDWSWDVPSVQYLKLYNEAVRRHLAEWR
jgi:starch synthase